MRARDEQPLIVIAAGGDGRRIGRDKPSRMLGGVRLSNLMTGSPVAGSRCGGLPRLTEWPRWSGRARPRPKTGSKRDKGNQLARFDGCQPCRTTDQPVGGGQAALRSTILIAQWDNTILVPARTMEGFSITCRPKRPGERQLPPTQQIGHRLSL